MRSKLPNTTAKRHNPLRAVTPAYQYAGKAAAPVKTLQPIHPGVTLKEDLMEPYDLSASKIADMLNVPHNRITSIVAGNRSITAETAMKLEKCFGISAEFWLRLQLDYDLECAKDNAKEILAGVVPYKMTS